ncbi:MAG: hypothetical protein ACXWUB_12435 [Burkholderiales bacterium]
MGGLRLSRDERSRSRSVSRLAHGSLGLLERTLRPIHALRRALARSPTRGVVELLTGVGELLSRARKLRPRIGQTGAFSVAFRACASFFLLQPIKALLMFVLGFLPRLLFAIEPLLAQMLLALPGFLLLPAALYRGDWQPERLVTVRFLRILRYASRPAE